MRYRDPMGLAGMGRWFGQTNNFWTGLKRFDWTGWMPRRRDWAHRLQRGRMWASRWPQRCRHKALPSSHRRQTKHGLPCWGLGFAAGWPWG